MKQCLKVAAERKLLTKSTNKTWLLCDACHRMTVYFFLVLCGKLSNYWFSCDSKTAEDSYFAMKNHFFPKVVLNYVTSTYELFRR